MPVLDVLQASPQAGDVPAGRPRAEPCLSRFLAGALEALLGLRAHPGRCFADASVFVSTYAGRETPDLPCPAATVGAALAHGGADPPTRCPGCAGHPRRYGARGTGAASMPIGIAL